MKTTKRLTNRRRARGVSIGGYRSACSATAAMTFLIQVGLLACHPESSERAGATDQTTTTALAEYQLGRQLWTTRSRDDLLRAAPHFERAISLDPAYAPAWSGLADSLALLGLYSVLPPGESMPRARNAARQALELDPRLAEAHASLGLALYLYDWDWQSAEDNFVTSLEIDPGYATAHHWYAQLLMATARHDEAVARIDQALAADPASRIIAIKAATIFTAAGSFERAEEQLRSCLERYPKMPLVHREIGFLRLRQGRPEEAVTAFELAAELSGGASRTAGGLGHAYAAVGRTADARRVLSALEERATGELVPPIYLALVHAGLGEKQAALDRLEDAFAMRDPGLVYLLTKPGLESLYEEESFRRLVDRIGLSTAQ